MDISQPKQFLLFVILFALATIGLAQEPPKLNGTWEVNIVETLEYMRANQRVQFDSLSATKKEQIIQSFASRRFDFQDSGNLTVHWTTGNNSRTMDGKWAASQDALEIVDDKGTAHSYRISFPDASTVILTFEGQTGLFSKLCLKKTS